MILSELVKVKEMVYYYGQCFSGFERVSPGFLETRLKQLTNTTLVV